MEKSKTFVITISRQLGSGGAYIGQQLAKQLDIFYADREIINKVANQYSVMEEDLQSNDEKILSFWQSFMQFNTFSSGVYVPPKLLIPSDKDLFQAEAEVIEHIASERSAVIIGRCGSYILRDTPNHIRLFLHGDIASRKKRIQNLYHIAEDDAEKMISKSDKERAYYCKKITGMDWTDARNYDMSFDTSKTDIDQFVELVLDYMSLIGLKKNKHNNKV